MGQLQDAHAQLIELGFQILFISPTRPEILGPLAQERKYDYTLLSDSSAAAARAFGIAYRVDYDTLVKYKKYGIDLEADSGQAHHLLPVPAVFVFDKQGRITFSHVDPNYKQRIAPEVLLAVARTSKR